MLVDTHCHLNQYTPTEASRVVSAGRAAGVSKFITAGLDEVTSRRDVERAKYGYRGEVWVVVGVHPWWAACLTDVTRRNLEDLATRNDCVIGVGEIGLDRSERAEPTMEVQVEVFKEMLLLAKDLEVPVVVHGDKVDEGTHRILREHVAGQNWNLGGVVHGFQASTECAKAWMELGFCISFNGTLHWPVFRELRELVVEMPKEWIVLESDAPAKYAPTPELGSTPGDVRTTAELVARLRDRSLDEVCATSSANVLRVFPRLRAYGETADSVTCCDHSEGSRGAHVWEP